MKNRGSDGMVRVQILEEMKLEDNRNNNACPPESGSPDLSPSLETGEDVQAIYLGIFGVPIAHKHFSQL